MQIYLARPGGPVQGPYVLRQINAELAAKSYRDDEFWAWHNGLTNWVPLYSVGGVLGAADTTIFFAKRVSEPSTATTRPPEPPGPDTTIFLTRPPWFGTVQQRAKSNEPKAPAPSAVEDTVLMGAQPARREVEASAEPKTEKVVEVAVCVAPKSRPDEAPRESAAAASATRKVASPVEPLVAEPKAQEPEKGVQMGSEPAHEESRPPSETKTAEAAMEVAPTSAAEELPEELSAPTPANGELITPAAQQAPINSTSPATTASGATVVVPRKRRARAIRRVFLQEGRLGGRRTVYLGRPKRTSQRLLTPTVV
jgi:hypothetical protein